MLRNIIITQSHKPLQIASPVCLEDNLKGRSARQVSSNSEEKTYVAPRPLFLHTSIISSGHGTLYSRNEGAIGLLLSVRYIVADSL